MVANIYLNDWCISFHKSHYVPEHIKTLRLGFLEFFFFFDSFFCLICTIVVVLLIIPLIIHNELNEGGSMYGNVEI